MAPIKYKIINNFFNKNELKVYQDYCFYKLNDLNEIIMDEKVFSPSWNKDPLMYSILNNKKLFVEKQTNLKLFPTYAYWRYYVFGGTLEKHVDRPSCEISITACIKKEDDWPLLINEQSIELKEGQALLYAGCHQEHGRPGIYKGKGLAQVFLHYINKTGPFVHHAYDNFFKETGLKFNPEDRKLLDDYHNKQKR